MLDKMLDAITKTHIAEPSRPTWLWRAQCVHCGAAIVRRRVGRMSVIWIHQK